MSKDTLYGQGPHKSGVAGDLMTSRDNYLQRAAELNALAQVERDHADKLEFENLARAYLRLAKQAERNGHTNIAVSSIGAAQNERECPYIIEIAVPPNGLGPTLSAILDFHRDRKCSLRLGRSRRRDDQDYVRWCFASIAAANEFKKAFGGKLIFSLS